MITIRRYATGDEAQVKTLVTAIMNSEFHDSKAAYPTEDLENISHTYGGLGEAFFVACDGDNIVGTVGIKKEDDRVALLRRLFVAQPYRHQQIGLKLIDRALQFCAEVGYDELIFKTTSTMKRAIEICKKRGFVQRAKLNLGQLELMKFSLPVRNILAAKTKSHKD
ncbi:MAG TPA: GNAT family N-acetyltransferase [bacterium]|nr:GNAT family N-acetyltransferase [bacterium]